MNRYEMHWVITVNSPTDEDYDLVGRNLHKFGPSRRGGHNHVNYRGGCDYAPRRLFLWTSVKAVAETTICNIRAVAPDVDIALEFRSVGFFLTEEEEHSKARTGLWWVLEARCDTPDERVDFMLNVPPFALSYHERTGVFPHPGPDDNTCVLITKRAKDGYKLESIREYAIAQGLAGNGISIRREKVS